MEYPSSRKKKKKKNLDIFLTDKPFDSQRLNLHVDQQSAVCFHQCWSQSQWWLWTPQLDDSIDNAVNETKPKKFPSDEIRLYSNLS